MRTHFIHKLLFLVMLTGLIIQTGPSVWALSLPTSPNVQVPKLEQEAKDQSTRIEERKQLFQSAITEDSVARASATCENAQVKLGNISTRASELQRRRQIVYSDLVEQLTKLDIKLTNQNVPHMELHNSIDALIKSWTSLQVSMGDYTSALDDSRTIDCSADPRGFLASLTAARKAQIAVLEQNDAFQTHLKNIKQQLNNIKTVVQTDLPEVSLKASESIGRN